jgi:predicted N-acetyltransferase YhbS
MINKYVYDHARDYEKVNDLLYSTYSEMNRPNWLQPRWEYMHHHPFMDKSTYSAFAVWYDDEKLVGIVSSELSKGRAFLQLDPNYYHLKEDMVIHAERNLFNEKTGNLLVTAYMHDKELISILKRRGYYAKESNPWCEILAIEPSKISIPELPEGFSLTSLDIENDLIKLERVLWRGFENPGEPKGDIKSRELMQSAPNYKRQLNVVIKAPNGDYASYSGAWFDKENKVGLIEPVATDPDYRRMKLASVATLECVKRLGKLGAKLVYVDSGIPIYKAIGFKNKYKEVIFTK